MPLTNVRISHLFNSRFYSLRAGTWLLSLGRLLILSLSYCSSHLLWKSPRFGFVWWFLTVRWRLFICIQNAMDMKLDPLQSTAPESANQHVFRHVVCASSSWLSFLCVHSCVCARVYSESYVHLHTCMETCSWYRLSSLSPLHLISRQDLSLNPGLTTD